MAVFRSMTLASILAITLAACAQNPVDPSNQEHEAHHPPDTSSVPEDPMARMDAHMQAMQELRQKMLGAKTLEERQALMADHMRYMQKEMATMQGMGSMGGSGAPMDMARCRQMMMDRMGPPAARP